ncbi:hypothetical protein BOTBODRAFT_51724 [Botryobasidium botryosum FD-172 SS1]|uniref:Zn(2)-C6 fungal-type domain-containing protein n=1 Tax=Botryobasidium botryosum (strain FD-172 SS1) TaxID=930990 RepID=A0A067N691_BOTB1|nr:hypothetical protein BOTBODRAFT_51724 [Botryobasidium botryosum FD-172 SS1]
MAGDHVCPVCKATFTRPQHVARHMRSHTGDRPYKCQTCGDQFARSDLLSRHVNKCHSSPKNGAPNPRGQRAAAANTDGRIACDACNESKVRCDFGFPCAKCTVRKVQCTYPQPAGGSRRRRTSLASSATSTSFGGSDGSRPSTAGSVIDGILPLPHIVPSSTQPIPDSFVNAWSNMNMGYDNPFAHQGHNPNLRPLALSADGGAFYAPNAGLLQQGQQYHDYSSSSPTSAHESLEPSQMDAAYRAGAYRNGADLLRRAAVMNPNHQGASAGIPISATYNAWQQQQNKHGRAEDMGTYAHPFPQQGGSPQLGAEQPATNASSRGADVAFYMSHQGQPALPVNYSSDSMAQLALMQARQRVPSIASDGYTSSSSASSSYVGNYSSGESPYHHSAPGNYSNSSLTGAVPGAMQHPDPRIYSAFHGMSLEDIVAAAGQGKLPATSLSYPERPGSATVPRPTMTREPTFTQMREMWAAYVSEPITGEGKTPGQNRVFDFGTNAKSPGHGLAKRNSMPCLKTPRAEYTQHEVVASSGSQVTPRVATADSNVGRIGHNGGSRPSTANAAHGNHNNNNKYVAHPTISAEDAESLKSYHAACLVRKLPNLQAPRPKGRMSNAAALEMQAAAAWQEQAGYHSGPASAPPASSNPHPFPPMTIERQGGGGDRDSPVGGAYPGMHMSESPSFKKSASPPSARPSYKRLPSQTLGPEMHKRPQRNVPGANGGDGDDEAEMLWEDYEGEYSAEGSGSPDSDGQEGQHQSQYSNMRADSRMMQSSPSNGSPNVHHASPVLTHPSRLGAGRTSAAIA